MSHQGGIYLEYITIVGAGLAGSEAAWQIAQRGIKVKLFEMRPEKMTPAHHGSLFAELVCSNSFRANNVENAVGLLKEEMRQLDSLIMTCADKYQVPAGGALAVDREAFAKGVTESLEKHPLIQIVREEVTKIPSQGTTILATGPLTSDSLTEQLLKLTGEEFLYFYDAAAPIVDGESVDYAKAYWASRYNKGTADYLNCPLNKGEYESFYQALLASDVYNAHDFEKKMYFEGCMPIEEMARRGPQTLLFGPMKPVGLENPRTGERPYAVVQLRKDNIHGTLFNIVGFQTRLKWGEQKKVFRMIPGLEEAEFVRFGVMHRNTFINSPRVLQETTQLRKFPHLLIAGQISGVEGYVESAASGLVAGINAAKIQNHQETVIPPRASAMGSLLHYITHSDSKDFQPMNITFGLMPPWPEKIKDKRKKNGLIAQRALDEIVKWKLLI